VVNYNLFLFVVAKCNLYRVTCVLKGSAAFTIRFSSDRGSRFVPNVGVS